MDSWSCSSSIDAETVAKVLLDNVILEHGWPKEISY